MRVLVACEFSQVVTRAFRDKGHEAYSCDILPTEGNPEWHIQDDVLKHLDDGWDMMIAHDPCTYQCLSGVRWLHERPGRWKLLEQSCEFTRKLFNAPIPRIARENPIPHHYAIDLIGRIRSLTFQGIASAMAEQWGSPALPPPGESKNP